MMNSPEDILDSSPYLVGRYVVASNGVKNPHMELYLQDQDRRPGGYWTQFISNARVFYTEEEAFKVVSRLRYNDPRVLYIDEDGERHRQKPPQKEPN